MTIDDDSAAAPATVESAADAIVFADVEGVIRIWNAAAARLFGFAATEAIGQSLDLIVPEHLSAAHWSGFRSAMASGVTRLSGRAAITRALHKNGTRLYVEMSFAVVLGSAGQVIGSVAVARDATARYEEERARRQGTGT